VKENPDTAKSKESISEREIQGGVLSLQDRFWLDTVKNLTSNSITAIEKSAKQIISSITLLASIFFATIAFSSLETKLAGLVGRESFWLLLILMVLPLACWIVSLWLSILVFLPQTYLVNLNSPDLSREAFLEITRYKHRRLLQSYTALASGFVPLLIAIIVYLAS
jgi:hypothetical protein